MDCIMRVKNKIDPKTKEPLMSVNFRRFNRHRLTQINTDGELQTSNTLWSLCDYKTSCDGQKR